MVAALPVAERRNIIEPLDFDRAVLLRRKWQKIITLKQFDVAPYRYLTDLLNAKRQGTLEVVEEMIKEKENA